jgi:CheY-like chemotaxis protein
MNLPTILLVEDTEEDAFFFGRTLEKAGIHCDCNRAPNGAAAKEYLLSNAGKPHIVFLDLKMPEMDGFEVLDWLNDQPFKSDLTVIVLGGSDRPVDIARARELGANDYLIKPVASDALVRIVGTWFLKHDCSCPPYLR